MTSLLPLARLCVLPVTVAILLASTALVRPRQWESVLEFVPVGGGQASRLERLAGTFGLSGLTGESVGQSPDFYVHLLGTDQFIRALAFSCVQRLDASACSDTVSSLLGLKGIHSASDSARAVRLLRERIGAGAGQNSGVIQLRVRMGTAEQAAAVNRLALNWIAEFNASQRSSIARAERQFLEERASATLLELNEAEAEQARFAAQNRDMNASPQLRVEFERLQREVQTRASVYTDIRGALERSRLEEVRNTPQITVVQPPTVPLRPLSRSVALWGLVGILLGSLIEVARNKRLRDGIFNTLALTNAPAQAD